MREDYAPVRFAMLTGCRRVEIVELTWQSIDFFGRTIAIKGKGEKDPRRADRNFAIIARPASLPTLPGRPTSAVVSFGVNAIQS